MNIGLRIQVKVGRGKGLSFKGRIAITATLPLLLLPQAIWGYLQLLPLTVFPLY